MSDAISIREGQIEEAFSIYEQIPEFAVAGRDGVDLFALERRLGEASGLVLIAERGGELVGFKAGYDRFAMVLFYSWLGGVLPAARGLGVAQQLLDAQEQRVAESGYDRLYVKTRNRFVPMLRLLLGNGYAVVGVALPDDLPLADGRLTADEGAAQLSASSCCHRRCDG